MMRVGPAGLPFGETWNTVFSFLSENKLSAFEVQFVYGARMKQEVAKQVKKSADENGISLSIHAPYYINFCGEASTIENSKKYIIDSALIASIFDAKVIFHPGFYLEQPKDVAYKKAEKAIADLLKKIPKDVVLAVETMGKQKQFGNLDEVLSLCQLSERIVPCVDWAHLHAYGFGRFKTEKDFEVVVDQIEKSNSALLSNLHQHFSCIHFNNGSERNHLPLSEKQPDLSLLVNVLKRRKVNGTMISETPVPMEGALQMLKMWGK